MKFGVNTFIWDASFGPEHFPLLPRIKAAGFDGIEVPMLEPANFPAAAVRRELEQTGLQSTAVAIMPAGLSLGSPDADVRQRAQTHVRDCLNRTAELGGEVLAGPLYSPVGYITGVRRTPDEWSWAIDSWRELKPAVSQSGVTVAIEPLNRFETYFLNTVADAVAMCDAIDHPSIGILFDTFHANIEEKSIPAAIHLAKPHLKHLHTCENDRGTPGTGNVDWPGFFGAVREIGYNGWMTIESFGFSIGAVSAAASIWRDLAATPETIAWDGVQYLRRHVPA